MILPLKTISIKIAEAKLLSRIVIFEMSSNNV